MPTCVVAHPSRALSGDVTVPGDKSISHRALLLGALAEGETCVSGLLEADDVLRTAAIVRALGASVEKTGGLYMVRGTQWSSPARPLYCGNAGTGARLLMGALAGQGIAARLDGDESLRLRPMERVLTPLRDMGLKAQSADGRLPVEVFAGELEGINYRLPKPSAQMKSAVLLAGLGARGVTVVEEPVASRDHTERMLPLFDIALEIEAGPPRTIRLTGPAKLTAPSSTIAVPGDPSSAAFPVVAALIVPGSEITVRGVLMNAHRTGFLLALREMGAEIEEINEREAAGERIMDLVVRAGALRSARFKADCAPAMIDEYPILAVAAAYAEGTTRFDGLSELRVKESDRLSATAALLRDNGVVCRTGEDWLEVDGAAGRVQGGGAVATHHDHRIAMSGLVLGFGAQRKVAVDGAEMIATSFPNFASLMAALGARAESVEA